MSFIDSLKNWGCTKWYLLHTSPRDFLSTSTGTYAGNPQTYTLNNGYKAAYLDGSTYIYQLGSTIPDQTFAFAIDIMPTVTQTETNYIFNSRNSDSTHYIELTLNSSNILTFGCYNGSTTITTTYSTALTNNTWYHVVCTHSSTATGLYINGGIVATGGAVTLTLENLPYSSVGCHAATNSNQFTGCVRNLMIFNQLPTTSRLKKLYAYSYSG